LLHYSNLSKMSRNGA